MLCTSLIGPSGVRCGGVAPASSSPPSFERSAKDNPDIVHGKLDTEAEQGVAAAAGITAIPTVMAFRKAVLVFNQAGVYPGRRFGSTRSPPQGQHSSRSMSGQPDRRPMRSA